MLNWLSTSRGEPSFSFRLFTLSFTKYEYDRPEPFTETKPVSLDKVFEIPRKPRAATPITTETVAPEPATGKRKRETEESEEQGPSKRVAGESTNGDGDHPIVLDDSGAILIDD